MSTMITATAAIPASYAVNDHEMSSALKVSEQVLREKLKAELDAAKKERESYKDSFFEPSVDAYLPFMERSLELVVNKATDLTKLRLAFFGLYADKDDAVPRSNYQMMCKEGRGIISRLIRMYAWDSIKKMNELGVIDVSFSFDGEKFPLLKDVNLPSVTYEVPLPIEVKDLIKERLIPHMDMLTQLDRKVVDLHQKLENINETVKQIEARIIVNNLSNDDNGKKVLSLASDIIAQVLGEAPELFSLVAPK